MNPEIISKVFPDCYNNTIAQRCAICGSKRINSIDFRDGLSKREFKISGMCQECQDKTFTEDEPQYFCENYKDIEELLGGHNREELSNEYDRFIKAMEKDRMEDQLGFDPIE